ncbi:hypothetical protein [Paenibacillus odorifer]|uniref:hypothetical protein n=1 Tax=Paenibacillus odorifer TaxID=189426 RepID=UPI00096E0CB8|nr:hypothetical protein [Paenibacillus odorifer]OMD76840.1 hypothetical protein BSK50_13895 [Paenibacillus odorifer]
MKKVYKGSAIKEWFLDQKQKDIRRILTPTRDSFHILNLDEIEDETYYIMSERYFGEVVIELAELIQ